MLLVAGGVGSGGVLASADADPASGHWTFTGDLNTARDHHTATLLPNGAVLAAQGLDSTSSPSTSAELYDPASGSWTPTGNLNTARRSHTATLLPNGMLLVAGGFDTNFGPSASAERFYPAKRELDYPPVVSTTHVIFTRQRCCPMAWRWLLAELG